MGLDQGIDAFARLGRNPGDDQVLVAGQAQFLAGCAGMSRTAFAVTFRDVVGQTPADYLSDWRVALAQTRLRAGQPVKAMAEELGYAHPSALSRAFGARVGMSPRQWLAQVSAGDAPR